ncbi:hypothetical protein KKC45_00560 [Patescibacteria group bacterium]|nr:hypothetical protein [Patescibacteria group bacterium]
MKNVSLLRSFLEDIPEDKLGLSEGLTWKPAVEVDAIKLGEASPTTEYSANEDSE